MNDVIYAQINRLLKEQKQAALAIIVSATPGTPRKVGAKMLIHPDGSIVGTIGGGKFEKQIIDEAVKVCSLGEAVMLNEDLSSGPQGLGAVCGGQVSIFIEPILKKPKMFIFGAGHVGKAIAQMAQHLDFALNVIDDRKEWANKDNYPMECILWTDDLKTVLEEIPLDKNSYVIILTRSWKMDEFILKSLLKREYKYLGIIGSKKKLKTHYDNLIDEGFQRGDFNRTYSPIGIPIGAYSPHEIAVSILAEVIAVEKGVRDQLPGWKNAISLRD